MSIVLFIGGFSRSGKTTTIDYLKSSGIPCYSTSAILNQTYNYLCSTSLISNKRVWDEESKPELRKQLICLAEDVLVPVFGREVFAHTVVRRANQSTAPLVVIETVGGEEFKLGLDVLTKPYFCWNIRKEGELKGVDLRELLEEGVNIWNDGSIEDLKKKIDDRVVNLQTKNTTKVLVK